MAGKGRAFTQDLNVNGIYNLKADFIQVDREQHGSYRITPADVSSSARAVDISTGSVYATAPGVGTVTLWQDPVPSGLPIPIQCYVTDNSAQGFTIHHETAPVPDRLWHYTLAGIQTASGVTFSTLELHFGTLGGDLDFPDALPAIPDAITTFSLNEPAASGVDSAESLYYPPLRSGLPIPIAQDENDTPGAQWNIRYQMQAQGAINTESQWAAASGIYGGGGVPASGTFTPLYFNQYIQDDLGRIVQEIIRPRNGHMYITIRWKDNFGQLTPIGNNVLWYDL